MCAMKHLKPLYAKLTQPGVVGIVRAVLVVAICLGGLLMAAHIYAVSGKTRIAPIASLESQCASKAGVMLSGQCIKQSSIIQLRR